MIPIGAGVYLVNPGIKGWGTCIGCGDHSFLLAGGKCELCSRSCKQHCEG